MTYASTRMFKLFMVATFCVVLAPGGVLAHSHEAPGDHIKDFPQHIDDYEKEVNDLVARLHDIAARYRPGKEVSEDVHTLVDAWEEVDFHEALEHQVALLYPPIWQAVLALREAVSSDAKPDKVARLAERMSFALHQGLGGLKLKAEMVASGEAPATEAKKADDGDAATTIARIDSLLEQSASAYGQGDPDAAKVLIHRAYINHFEGIEGALIEQDPELVLGLEVDFNAKLPNLIDAGASPEALRQEMDRIRSSLDTAQKLLAEAEQNKSEVF